MYTGLGLTWLANVQLGSDMSSDKSNMVNDLCEIAK